MDIQTQTAIDTIFALHKEVEQNLKTAISKAIQLGGIIIQEKAKLGHGNFSAFLAKLPFSERTARRYMLLWENQSSVSGLTFKDAYKLIGGAKTDTMADLQKDDVCIALNALVDRAWHLQFSGGLCWNKQKYDFTVFLRECWQDWEKVNPYMKKHISDQLTVRKSNYMENVSIPDTCWIEAIIFELCMLEADLKERTFEKDMDEWKRKLKETNDAPKKEWDLLNRMTDKNETVLGLTFGEYIWNLSQNTQFNVLQEDAKHIQTVFAAFHKRLGNDVCTIKEERKKANQAAKNCQVG